MIGRRRIRTGPKTVIWLFADCPGCGLPVAFLPSQYVNTCAWCRTVVCRGLE